MLRVIPKHKGTDHLQGDIKRRIKELSEELERPRTGGARGGPPLVIRPEGAAQIALIGPPNAGKSALHARLTGSGAPVAPYPFTTQHPEPGMLPHEDVRFQLVDLPAVSPEHPRPWLGKRAPDGRRRAPGRGPRGARVRRAGRGRARRAARAARHAHRPVGAGGGAGTTTPFAVRLPTLLLANKADRLADPDAELRAFLEVAGLRYPALAVSATTGQGLDRIGPWLFGHLGIARVYTKAPGRPANRDRPFTLRQGQTVQDVARLVHKDLARSLKYARVWGRSGFGGQQVGREHPVADGDVVELHA